MTQPLQVISLLSCGEDESPTAPARRPADCYSVTMGVLDCSWLPPGGCAPVAWDGTLKGIPISGGGEKQVYLPLNQPLPIRAVILPPDEGFDGHPHVAIARFVDDELISSCSGYSSCIYPCDEAVNPKHQLWTPMGDAAWNQAVSTKVGKAQSGQ